MITVNDSCESAKETFDNAKRFGYSMKGSLRISTYGTPANFTCQECKGSYAYYNFQDKEMICTECHHIEPIKSEETECGRCKTIYIKYTWFDPDCCPNCRKNFVD